MRGEYEERLRELERERVTAEADKAQASTAQLTGCLNTEGHCSSARALRLLACKHNLLEVVCKAGRLGRSHHQLIPMAVFLSCPDMIAAVQNLLYTAGLWGDTDWCYQFWRPGGPVPGPAAEAARHHDGADGAPERARRAAAAPAGGGRGLRQPPEVRSKP